MAAIERTFEPIYFRALATQPWERGDRAAAAEVQRARLLHAMTRAVSEKGYAKVTVADIVALAGVSRRTFYQHFKDAEDCFVAAYEAATNSLLAEIESAVLESWTKDWRDRFELAVTAYLQALASDPYAARACLVDVLGAGPRALEARRLVFSKFVTQMQALRYGSWDRKGPIPESQFRATVGAIGELVQEHLFSAEAGSLAELTPALVGVAWALLESPFESRSG